MRSIMLNSGLQIVAVISLRPSNSGYGLRARSAPTMWGHVPTGSS